MLMQPRLDRPGRGLICTSFVTLAYQVAELEDHVTACENLSWCSDKYADLSRLGNQADLQNYQQYASLLRTKNYRQYHETFPPSILFWNHAEKKPPRPESISSSLQIDSKHLSCNVLCLYLSERSDCWTNIIIDHHETPSLTI